MCGVHFSVSVQMVCCVQIADLVIIQALPPFCLRTELILYTFLLNSVSSCFGNQCYVTMHEEMGGGGEGGVLKWWGGS